MAIKLGRWEKGKVAKSVYERCDGLKIHGAGLIKPVGADIVLADYTKLQFCIKLVGGRRTRAMMHYANLYHTKEQSK
ncbi:MAG: hypothetical protein ACUZ8E_17665 [Candidatus Anammoxibacter sp.]